MCKDVADRHREMILAQPVKGAQLEDILRRDEAGPQQSVAVKHGLPLAVLRVALASGQIAGVGAIEDSHLKALLLEMIVERDPINSRGFHGHLGDLGVLEIRGQKRDLAGECAEALDGLGRCGGGDKEVLRADVDAGESRQDFIDHDDDGVVVVL